VSIFAGAVSTDGRPLPPGLADRLSSATGFYDGEDGRAWASPHAVFVHRQRIVTPEDAFEAQPLVGGGGSRVLALDGRLDNREEVIAALGLETGPTPLADSRIVMAALERWGLDAPERLIGDFAFASWDEATRTLTLACDQIGMRTVYYHHGDGILAFATMVHAVHAVPGVPRDVDEAALASVLIGQGPEETRTVYRAVDRVPPAGRLVAARGGVRVDRYWEPDFGRRLRLKDDECVEAARELLGRCVAARLRVVGPLVAEVTGGLDSSAVAATAARLCAPQTLKTVTAVPEPGAPLQQFRSAYCDERPYVEAIARMHPNMEPAFLWSGDVAGEELDASRVFLMTALPLAMPINTGWMSSARAHARSLGARAVLTGTAGNLTLSWNGRRALADMARSGRWVRALVEARSTARYTGEPLLALLRMEVAAPLAPAALYRLYRRLRGRPDQKWTDGSPISPDLARATGLDGSISDIGRGRGPLFADPMRLREVDARRVRLSYFRSSRALLASLRPYLGYELRDPLADPRLIEFCLSLPADQYLHQGVPRRLARRVLADRLPGEVVENRRRGFQGPEWFLRLNRCRDALMAELEQLDRSTLARRCLDVPRLKAIAADWPADLYAAQARYDELNHVLVRGIHTGQFLRWIERGDGA